MSAKKNWLWGCGIGCGLLLLIAIAIPVAGGLFLGSAVEGFDRAVASRQELETRFGTSDTFQPWPTGSIPADRIEAFLLVRDASQPARINVSKRFETIFSVAAQAEDINEKGVLEKLRIGLGLARTGVGLAPDLGALFDERNQALLAAEMGLGEYAYLYSLAYYGLLEHSPDDGPEDSLEDMNDNHVDIGGGIDTSSRRVRRELRGMLESQLAAMPPADGGEGDPAWHDALVTEIAALESRRDRVPWQDGLPESLRASLEPFRERLEATYDPNTNPFELARNERRGKFSFSAD